MRAAPTHSVGVERQICICQYKPQVPGISFAYLRKYRLQVILAYLEPVSSKRARATAVKAFVRFLHSDNADIEYVKGCNQRDDSEQCFASVMDSSICTLHLTKAGLVSRLLDILASSTIGKLSIGC